MYLYLYFVFISASQIDGGVADRNLDTSFGYLRDGWPPSPDNRYRDYALLTTPPDISTILNIT